MKKMFLCFFLLVAATVFAQKNSTKKDVTDITITFDNYIKNALQLWKTPGISIVIVKDGNIVFKRGYGVTEINKTSSFTTSSLSICASTTKAMTAVCMGMLVDEGKLRWDDKVTDIYPEFKLYDNYANSEITVKDLFTHNTGLGNADWFWILDYPLDTIIHQMRYLKPEYSFRSSFIYQNLMYMVAGEVIHKVSGKTWDQFIQERLFTPLGMTHTYPKYGFSLNEPSHITPHFTADDSTIKTLKFIDSKSIDAAGGVWSCVDDMGKWLTFLLDSARINSKALLKPETFSFLFQPQAMVTPEEFYPTAKLTKPHWTTYGLGWFQEDYKGKMVQFHTGSLDGAVAICGLIPDEHFGVYIFGNLDHSEIRHALMYKAMDLFALNDNSNDWSKDFYYMYSAQNAQNRKKQKENDAKRVLNTRPSLDLKEYAGTYSNDIFGIAEVVFENDSLTLKFPNDISIRFTHWNFDTFKGFYNREEWGSDLFTFVLDASGNVDHFSFGGMEYFKQKE